MDLAELLMVDHSMIRTGTKWISPKSELVTFVEFSTFIDGCHVQVEEKVFFPVISEYPWEDHDKFKDTVNRIKADHRLIKALGDNLKKWNESGDPLFGVRLPLYFKTVKDHNETEEKLIFPRWLRLDAEVKREALINGIEIIRGFGIENYTSETGMSEDFLSYLSRGEPRSIR